MSEKKIYKVINVLRPALDSHKANLVLEQCMQGLEIISQDMKTSELAYPIDHNKQGHLASTSFSALPEQIQKVRRKLEINEDVLRTIFIARDKKHDFNVSDDFIKKAKSYTTKRGKIIFPKNSSRSFKSQYSKIIKRLRFIGLLPYCNYYA